ncbi:MAG: MarR family transcriptional regulator [Anaerolineaceae bacterium]|nr:MarR family transcriptional regulator [Anaerolineaceae bacterium]
MRDDADLTKILMDWSAVFMRLSMRDFVQYSRVHGLSLAQMNVLMHLYYRGPLEVTQFVELLQISPPAASQLVERLVLSSLVLRTESPIDRRIRLVSLTDSGRKMVQESVTAREQWLENLMTSLNDQQKHVIADTLKTLTENAQQLDPSLKGTHSGRHQTPG